MFLKSHSKFESQYSIVALTDVCEEDLEETGWVYWTKKYIGVKNICVTFESGRCPFVV